MPLFVPPVDYGPAIAALTVGNKHMLSDVLFTASTSPVDLVGLTTPTLLAGGIYSFHICLPATNTGTGGFGVSIVASTLTATTFAVMCTIGTNGGSVNGTVYNVNTSLNSGFTKAADGTGTAAITLVGTITVAVGGTFTVQGQQASANGTTTFLKGGFMQIWGPY